MAKLPIKKMITEVLLILPLYLIWFFIWWRFRHLIKIIADAQNTLNNDDFSGDIVDKVDSLSLIRTLSGNLNLFELWRVRIRGRRSFLKYFGNRNRYYRSE